MNTKQKKILIVGVGAVLVLAIAVVVFFGYRNAKVAEQIQATTELQMASTDVQIDTEEKNPTVPEIKKELPDVIPEPTDATVEELLPPPDVTETIDKDGNIVQTPNWDAQKELAPDTDLEDSDTVPEYVKPAPKNPTPAPTPQTTTPKVETPAPAPKAPVQNGDQKVIDGHSYTYVEGFGWVKYQGENVITDTEITLSGNKVGH